MKTAVYQKIGGGELKIEYDENAPCIICGEPVIEASMGGTAICPWCDCGNCRYCGVQLPFVFGDQEKTKQKVREHMKWHKEHPASAEDK